MATAYGWCGTSLIMSEWHQGGDEQLWPVCLRGARALAAVIRTVPAGRQAVVCSCPPYVRLVLDALGPSLNYLPADYLPADKWALPPSGTLDLVNRVREARLHACVAKLDARAVLDRLTDNSIRLASIGERMDLTRQQGQQTLASAGAAREYIIQSRQQSAVAKYPRSSVTGEKPLAPA